jgi:hypothetical protein
MKVQRAVNSLVRILGGWRPFADNDSPVAEEDEDEPTETH